MDPLSFFKNRLPLGLFLPILWFWAAPLCADGVNLQTLWIHNIPVHVVKVDLSKASLTVQMPPKTRPPEMFSRMAFQHLLDISRPEMAINGAFFHTKTFQPIGDIFINGQEVNRGNTEGTAFILDEDGKAMIKDARWFPHDPYWSDYNLVLVCGPRIVENGQLLPDMITRARAYGFKDPSVYARKRRSAMGIIDSQHVIFVVTLKRADIWKMAKIMKSLKAKEAMCLDGGSSSGMYVQGKLLVKPNRELTNILVVNNSKPFTTAFAPIKVPTLSSGLPHSLAPFFNKQEP